MSYQQSALRKSLTYLPKSAILLCLAILWMLMSIPALADPPKTTDETPPPAVDNSVKGDVEDPAKPAIEVETPSIKPMEAPKDDMQVKKVEPESLAKDASYHCYEQDSGKTECICKGAKACADLKAADICAIGSEWGKDELSGCTKKTE